MAAPLDDAALDQLFRQARSHGHWTDRPVPETLLRAVYDLVRTGPTAFNGAPARFVFVRTEAGRRRLSAAAIAANQAKILAAPVTVVVGYDLDFADRLPELYPPFPGARDLFADPEQAQATAFRNSSLQAGYLMLAARSLGLDVGPMSGFDAAAVEREFFPDGRVRANLICSLGYGAPERLHPRLPRLAFEDACQIV